ncbi:MAG: hypothetical protein GON13_02100 [Nanoarchaeota archaeon]|nr:hypothetical protein [Nanoarchaeota archaeon]
MEKVLVIGIDAMDQRIINRLDLPNLKSLQTRKKLETTIPPETPVAWSAASTGTNPGKYGIFDFINRNPKTYLPKLNLTNEKRGIIKTEYSCAMQGKPFWKILNEKGIPSTVMRWPVTFPAEKIDGKMLSGLGVVDVKGMLNKYSYYSSENEKNEEDTGNIIKIPEEKNFETYVSGPLIMKSGALKDVRTPLRVTIQENGVNLNLNGKEYFVKEKSWSEMISVKFKIYLMNVYGIFKVYLKSIKPFKMYMTSIQVDPTNQIYPITYPKEYGKELVENIGLFYTLGMTEDTKAITENKISYDVFLQQINQIENEREKMFEYEFKKFNKGVFAFAFDAGDRLKHLFWSDKTDSEGMPITIPEPIKRYYTQKDKFIGNVLSRISENTKLLIFSDHGFNSFKWQFNLNSWLVKEGFMKVNTREGKLLQYVDWNKTQAYSLGFTSAYLNLKGRESKGILTNTNLVDEIIKKLRTINHNGRKVFTNVYKGNEIYKGAYAELAPDMIVGFSPEYRMSDKSAIGILENEIINKNTSKWSGDHLIDRSHVPGVLFANFKTSKEFPNIMDIAPTTLKLFNINPPEHMDGESLI